MYTQNDLTEMDLEDGIFTLSLKEKCFSRELLELLSSLFSRLRSDDQVLGILIAGISGENPAPPPDSEPASFSALGQQVMFALEGLGKPVIAACDGAVVGASLELALACDFILASTEATFGFPAILSGELPCFGGTQRLTRAVGKARAKEMLFTGRSIAADEACAAGLVNRLFEKEELHAAARRLLSTICSQGTLALRMAKEVVDAGHGLDLKRGCLMERDAFALCFATHDQREGMGSFLERRPAEFKGR